jgi:hypothetical protein
MTALLQHTGALGFLIVWGLAAGGYIAWRGARQLQIAVTLAKIVEAREAGRATGVAFKSAFAANLLGTLVLMAVALGWLPLLLTDLLFGLGRPAVGYAPLQVVAMASFFPLLAGAIYRRRWRRRYRGLHTADCPRCGRVNDRPHFPEHHRYPVVFGYAAVIDGDRHLCRWCQTPLTFPRLAS